MCAEESWAHIWWLLLLTLLSLQISFYRATIAHIVASILRRVSKVQHVRLYFYRRSHTAELSVKLAHLHLKLFHQFQWILTTWSRENLSVFLHDAQLWCNKLLIALLHQYFPFVQNQALPLKSNTNKLFASQWWSQIHGSRMLSLDILFALLKIC